jgi:flagellar biosynthetic protein FliR
MISITSDLLQTWVITLMLPLTRVLAVIATAPILNHRAHPARVKLGMGLLLTLAIMPTLPPIPSVDVFSLQGLLLLAQQLLIGVAIGFTMRIFFAAIDLAGQLIGSTMGFGFAMFFDPQSQGQTMVINQFVMILTMLIFLSLDGHLLIVSLMSQSFISMPIALNSEGINPIKVAQWGEEIFGIGLLLSLPCVATLLIINMALGILTRTAPQLNLFGIGFPVTLSMGFLILLLALPGMLQPIEKLIQQGFNSMREVVSIPDK